MEKIKEKMVNLKINGIAVTVPEGTTILQAARKAHIEIPTLCFLKDVSLRGVMPYVRGRGYRRERTGRRVRLSGGGGHGSAYQYG